MRACPERSRRVDRRLLGCLIVGPAAVLVLVGAFWLGVLVGEIRGGTRPAFGEPAFERSRPFSPIPFRGWPGWQEHRGKYGALGVVEAIEEDVLVVTGRWGTQVRVVITEETAFRRDRERITLADIRLGDHIAVLGRPRGEGEIEAKVIWVLPPPSEGRESWWPPST